MYVIRQGSSYFCIAFLMILVIYLTMGGASNGLINQIAMFITTCLYMQWFSYSLMHYCEVYLDHMYSTCI